MGDTRPIDLNVGDTLRTALGVLRRRWFSLFAVWLLFDGSTDSASWFANGAFNPRPVAATPARMFIDLAGIVIGGVLFAATAAQVVRADRVTGRPVTTAGVFALPWARLPELLLLWTLLAAPLQTFQLVDVSGVTAGLLWLASAVLDLGAYAVVSFAAALVLGEHLSGARPWAFAAAITRGVRIRLLTTLALMVGLVVFGRIIVDLSFTVIAMVLTPLRGPGASPGLLADLARFPGYVVLNAFAVFLVVWGSVVYLAARRSIAGLDKDGLDVFA